MSKKSHHKVGFRLIDDDTEIIYRISLGSVPFSFKGVQPDFRPNFENLGLFNRWH